MALQRLRQIFMKFICSRLPGRIRASWLSIAAGLRPKEDYLDQVRTIQDLKTTPQLGENRGQPIFHDAPTPSRRAAAGTACVIYLTPLAPNIKAYANT